jgi:hypothetical protein
VSWKKCDTFALVLKVLKIKYIYMVKSPIKTLKTEKNPINYTSDTPAEYKSLKKSRQEINREYYQRNREKRNEQEKERYGRKKQQSQQQEKEQLSKYSQASAYKILISFKEYTNLNPEKKHL